jgi:hypothetical protein
LAVYYAGSTGLSGNCFIAYEYTGKKGRQKVFKEPQQPKEGNQYVQIGNGAIPVHMTGLQFAEQEAEAQTGGYHTQHQLGQRVLPNDLLQTEMLHKAVIIEVVGV